MQPDVASREHAGHAGHRRHAVEAALAQDVAVAHLQVALEDVGVGLVANGDEAAGDGELRRRAVAGAAQAHAVDALGVAEHLVERRPQVQLHLSICHLGHHLVDQDRLGAELVASVDDVHLRRDVREIERLLDGRVASAHDAHLLAAIEEAVAGGAAADAAAHERFFRRQPEVLGRRAGGDDERVAGVLARVAAQCERTLAEFDLVDVVEDDLGVEALGMLQEALHEVGAHDAVDVGRPVVDVCRRHELAALGDAGDEHRLQVGARRVDRRRVAGRARAEDQDAGVV